LRGGRAGAPRCLQAEEIGDGLDRRTFAVVSSYGDRRTTMYTGDVRTLRWVDSSERESSLRVEL
jgi:hypothetical protein